MTNAWTGMELMNQSVAMSNNNNWGNYYRNGTFVITTYLPWEPLFSLGSSTNNRVAFLPLTGNIYTSADGNRPTVCEYEEALKQPVTDLEQNCVNLTSSFFTSFVNGICYVMHPETKTYNNAKMACNDLSDHKGHLVHVRTIGELWVADALRAAAGVTYARIGIEQTNPSSTDPTTGWYLTTPTSPSVLTTYLPWVTAPTTGMRTIAVTTGYPKTFNAVANTTLYPFICQNTDYNSHRNTKYNVYNNSYDTVDYNNANYDVDNNFNNSSHCNVNNNTNYNSDYRNINYNVNDNSYDTVDYNNANYDIDNNSGYNIGYNNSYCNNDYICDYSVNNNASNIANNNFDYNVNNRSYYHIGCNNDYSRDSYYCSTNSNAYSRDNDEASSLPLRLLCQPFLLVKPINGYTTQVLLHVP
uniref:C-type lectin domain-containing protein n=1 Tax=Plectus sambesii TaxID=2011161 RepID=A0A914XRH3_9BILA